jgi:hypothetical protein
MTVGLNATEFDPHFHPDFKSVDVAIGDLSHQLYAIGQFGDADRVRSLVGKLRRRHSDYAISQQLARIRENRLLEFPMAALRTNQSLRKQYLTAFLALGRFEPIAMRIFSMRARWKHQATSNM